MDLFGGLKKIVSGDTLANKDNVTQGKVVQELGNVAGAKMGYSPEATKALSAAQEMAAVNKIVNKKPGDVITKNDRLNANRYAQRQLGLEPTGILSEADKTAIENFQRKHGLGPDGDPGKNTLAALRKNASCSPDSVVLKMPNGSTQCVSSDVISSIALVAGGPAAGIISTSPELQQLAAGVFNGSVEAVGSPEAKAALREARKVGGKAWDGIKGGLGTAADKTLEVGGQVVGGVKKFSKDTGLTAAAGKVGSFFTNLGSSSGTAPKTNQEDPR